MSSDLIGNEARMFNRFSINARCKFNLVFGFSFRLGALVLLLSALSAHVYAQRCAGHLLLVLRDKEGTIMDTQNVRLRYLKNGPSIYEDDQISLQSAQLIRYKFEERMGGPDKPSDRSDSIKVLRIFTGCGIKLVEAALEYDNQHMLLRFRNVPAELDFFVDSVPFRRGTYEIDFSDDMKLKGNKLEQSLEYKHNQIMRFELVVSQVNWKKLSPESLSISEP